MWQLWSNETRRESAGLASVLSTSESHDKLPLKDSSSFDGLGGDKGALIHG